MKRAVLALLGSLWLFPGLARAQEDDAPIGQGEASINVRSDVKLGIKGTGGTTAERLTRLGEAVSEQMPGIRGCYRKLVTKNPEVVGGLRVQVALPETGRPKVDVAAGEGTSNDLARCVAKVLEAAKFSQVGRPAAAALTLEFDNTRARGQALMQQREAEAGRVTVTPAEGGGKQASWSTHGGAVTFTVRGEASVPDAAIELVLHGLQNGYAGFLDCRRRCEKGGLSPEGEIEAQLVLDRQGKSNVKLRKVTIAHERAPICGERAFDKVEFDKPPSVVRVAVTARFAR